MKKRVISSLLITLIVMSFLLPSLATEPAENIETPVQVGKALGEPVKGGPVQDEPIQEEPVQEEPVQEEPVQEEPVQEEPEPSSFVLLDGVPQFVEYELRNGTTYVTVSSFAVMADPRAVVEEANGVVTVSSARVEQVVDAEGNATDVVRETLSMTVSTQVPYIVANDRYLYAPDSITTVNGCVAIPIRKLAQVFNLDVTYDAEAGAALLTRVQGRGFYLSPGDSYYDADTLYWLSRVISVESGHQILEGKIAVGNVVLNRVKSREFPNTLYEVLNQKNQFVSTSTLSKRTPNSESVIAAKLVMDGAEVLPTALFFNKKGLSSYASRNRTYVTTIDNHDFYS